MSSKQLQDSRTVEEIDRGMYLKYIPDHFREKYEDSLQDPELTHLNRQIALLDIRVKTLVEQLDHQVLDEDDIASELREEFPDLDDETVQGLSSYFRARLPETFIDHRTFLQLEKKAKRYEDALSSRKIKLANSALDDLLTYIRNGRREGDVWNDIMDTLEQRRRLSKEEQARQREMQQSITLDKVVDLVGVVISSVREAVLLYVQDRETQDYILTHAQTIYQEQLGIESDQQ